MVSGRATALPMHLRDREHEALPCAPVGRSAALHASAKAVVSVPRPRGWGVSGYDEEGPDDLTPCHCGHVLDEHDPACTVEGCMCVHFEANPDEESAE